MESNKERMRRLIRSSSKSGLGRVSQTIKSGGIPSVSSLSPKAPKVPYSDEHAENGFEHVPVSDPYGLGEK